MISAASPPQKEDRGHTSLERKLVIQELGRRFWLLVKTDILIIALFFAVLIARSEYIAANTNLTEQNPVQITGLSVTRTDGQPEGVRLAWPINLSRATRDLFYDNTVTSHTFFNALTDLPYIKYSIALPALANKEYIIATFSFYEPVVFFEYAFSALLFFEAVGLIGSGFKIRESVRRTLRPIYDLTLAAQTINRNAAVKTPLPAQELHLSGAIDTLNTITENDLDRRIVIADEREELKGLAQAINSMLNRLDAAYRSQLRFVSDASHELRTPISVIQGYANMLDRWGKNDTATLEEAIDAIKSEASGMQNLVEQLLFLARSDNRSITLNVETVNTCALASEVFRETQMIDKDHEFKSRLPEEKLCVRGDMQLLKQALRIFVDNAIKYTPSGGMITISALDDGDYAKISVTDNGIGIPPDDLDKVFDRFFRSDKSRTRGTGGTGLGLSIAKWIIDCHGGYVEVTSHTDIGTKITAALPKFTGLDS